MLWIGDRYFQDAKTEDWFDAILVQVRSHPLAIRSMELARDSCQLCQITSRSLRTPTVPGRHSPDQAVSLPPGLKLIRALERHSCVRRRSLEKKPPATRQFAWDMNIETFARQHRLHTVRDPEDRTAITGGHKGKSHLFQYREGRLGVLAISEVSTAQGWNACGTTFLGAGGAARNSFLHLSRFALTLGTCTQHAGHLRRVQRPWARK